MEQNIMQNQTRAATRRFSVNAAIVVGLCFFMTYRAQALYSLFDCCTTQFGPCRTTTCAAQWDECECLGAWSATGCVKYGDCGLSGQGSITAEFAVPYWEIMTQASGSNYSAQSLGLPTTGLIVSATTNGDIQPVHFTVSTWLGTNDLFSPTVTSVSFYAVPSAVVPTYALSNNVGQLPWSYIGEGSRNPDTGDWALQWTPPTNEAYLIDADIYDPTITTAYTNYQGIVTNGIITALSALIPAPANLELAAPAILANGNFACKVVGPVASTCTVQVSPDLRVWNTAFTVTNFNGLANLIDASANTTHNYYRAISSR